MNLIFNIIRSIVLNPKAGFLYYSTWASENSLGQIMISWMDGTHRSVFVDVCADKSKCTDIQWPSSLTIDQMHRKLYWCDPRLETIERIGLDGKNREVILQRGSITHVSPFSMAFHSNDIYFTDISSGNITKFNLKDANHQEYVDYLLHFE